jgi:hypothetical protein
MDLPLLRQALELSDIGLRLEISFIVLSFCYSVFWIFQKIIPNYLFGEDSEYAGYIYNAMGVVFSLVFAFVTVLVWQNYNGVSDAINKEASSLNNMYRLFSAYPPDIDKKGKDSIRAYTTTVIEEEWPLLKKDQFSIKAYQELVKVEELIIQLQPQNIGQSNVQQQMLRLVGEATELRRSRVFNARFALAPPAWLGLISSSFIFLCFSCFFKMQSQRTHLILVLFLGLTIVGVIYFLVLYIHPFLGPMALEPDVLRNLLKIAWTY